MKGSFGADEIVCNTCGLRFILVGNGLNTGVRLRTGENSRLCQHPGTVSVVCPQIEATVGAAILSRLRP